MGELQESEHSREVLEKSLNPTVGGSNSSILEMTGKSLILKPIAIPSTEEGNLNVATGNPMYMGITPHPSHRLGMEETEQHKL